VVGVFALVSKKGIELLIVLLLERFDEGVLCFGRNGVDLIRVSVVRGLVDGLHLLVALWLITGVIGGVCALFGLAGPFGATSPNSARCPRRALIS